MSRRAPPHRVPAIRITPEVYRHYVETIAQHDPETVAILGGRLDDPFLVTDFRFCPPRRSASGAYDAGSAHINLDNELMNYIVDHEWKPVGKYCLGCWHSHPGNYSRPSHGDAASNEGDIVFFKSCLENDDSPDRNWHTFLAPITTFTADGRDQVHGWILRRGSSTPLPCPVIIDPFTPGPLDGLIPFSPSLPPELIPFLLSTANR